MDEEIIRAAFESFNAHNADGVLGLICEDVDWPNPLAGGRFKGRAALREYWALLWTSLDPQIEVLGISVQPDGRTVVEVNEVLRERGGLLLTEQRREQVYTLRDGLIAHMELRNLAPAAK